MEASGSGKGVSVGIDGKDAMDKTMEGMSLSEAGDLVDKGKGRVEGDVFNSMFYETVSRMTEDEKTTFMRCLPRRIWLT